MDSTFEFKVHNTRLAAATKHRLMVYLEHHLFGATAAIFKLMSALTTVAQPNVMPYIGWDKASRWDFTAVRRRSID